MQLANFTNNFCVSSKGALAVKKSNASSEQEKTILRIDDEEVVINISDMMLKRLGYIESSNLFFIEAEQQKNHYQKYKNGEVQHWMKRPHGTQLALADD